LSNTFRILVIDDDSDLLYAIKKVLSGAGFDTRVAENLTEGLSLLRKEIPELLIMDVVLPDGDGLATARTILHEHSFSSLNVILISGNKKSPHDLENAFHSGVIDYITKPFNTGELSRKVELIRRVHQLQRNQIHTEENYQRLFNNSSDIVFSLNYSGMIKTINQSFSNLTGYGIGDVKGNALAGFIFQADRQLFNEALSSTLGGLSFPPVEIRLVSKNGSPEPVSLVLSLINASDSEKAVLGIAKDLRQQKLLEVTSEDEHMVMTREMQSWGKLSAHETSMTALTYQGPSPFDTGTAGFEEMCRDYQGILEKMVEKRIFKVDYKPSGQLRQLAGKLGFLKASPREIIRINSYVLETLITNYIPGNSWFTMKKPEWPCWNLWDTWHHITETELKL